ncbi:hypothetical protein G9A89_005380 [Geosiphon pyriformis]|nr:hypothetical protein G9A89_005380 [Geosiphon pyriformis]
MSIIYPKHAYQTLYSCLMVNRQWFSIASRILWRQPFNMHRSLPKHGVQIIQTYIEIGCHYDKSIRKRLTKLKKKNESRTLKIPKKSKSSTLCYYAGFLEHLDFGTMLNFIWDWCGIHPKDLNFKNRELACEVTNILFDSIALQNPRIKYVKIFPGKVDCKKSYELLFRHEKAKELFENVTMLQMHGGLGRMDVNNYWYELDCWTEKFFAGLAGTFHNLRDFEICGLHLAYISNLSKLTNRPFPLIQVQKNLRSIRIHCCSGNLKFLLPSKATKEQNDTAGWCCLEHVKFFEFET